MTQAAATQARVFLRAEWRRLVFLNFEIDPPVLEGRVPRGTELDLWHGRALVSVVGFRFERTRALGLPVPWWGSFAEVNLRFYVRRLADDGVRRGVVFVKEIVPYRAIAATARRFYNENYVALPMQYRIEPDGDGLSTNCRLEYAWRHQDRWDRMSARTAAEGHPAAEGSEEQFITEHYWGYVRQPDGGTLEYRVEHPSWNVWQASDAILDCNAAALYGPEFCEVLGGPVSSAFVADGSPVVVYRGVRID